MLARIANGEDPVQTAEAKEKESDQYSHFLIYQHIWALSTENLTVEQRPACASAQSDQRLCYLLHAKYILNLLHENIHSESLAYI